MAPFDSAAASETATGDILTVIASVPTKVFFQVTAASQSISANQTYINNWTLDHNVSPTTGTQFTAFVNVDDHYILPNTSVTSWDSLGGSSNITTNTLYSYNQSATRLDTNGNYTTASVKSYWQARVTGTKTSKGTLYSKSDLQSFATQAGFTPSEAATMSRIGLAESGGYAGNDTVQSGMDPGQNNEYSIGLWQINTQAHMDKLTRRGWGKEDLRDPVKNATIAKEVYDEMGGSFEPWGAFTNGSYQEY